MLILVLRADLVLDTAGCSTLIALSLCLSDCLSVIFAITRMLDGMLIPVVTFQDGSFLVRDSTTDPDSPYTLILFFDNKVRSLRLRVRRDKMFAIGTEKPDEEV